MTGRDVMYFSVHMRFCVPSRMHLVIRPSHVCVGAVRALTPLRWVYINVTCAVRFDHLWLSQIDKLKPKQTPNAR